MSNGTDKSGPPGPAPSGPPGPAPDSVPAQDVTRYRDYLAKQGVQASAGELHEDEHLRVGSWRFYYRGAPGVKNDAVALNVDDDDGGAVVLAADKSTWRALLVTPGLDASGAHKRLAWLMGKVAPIDGSYKLRDAAAAAKVGAPTLNTGADGTVTFTGWVVYPPNMQMPYRLTVTAPKSGPATVTNTAWNKL